jgi:hypothetical protein
MVHNFPAPGQHNAQRPLEPTTVVVNPPPPIDLTDWNPTTINPNTVDEIEMLLWYCPEAECDHTFRMLVSADDATKGYMCRLAREHLEGHRAEPL